VPAAWSGRTAFNEFRDVAESLDRNGTIDGLTRYGYYIPLVRNTYGAFETACTNGQASTEASAASMTGSARIQYLTTYSASRAAQALNLAVGLPAQMP